MTKVKCDSDCFASKEGKCMNKLIVIDSWLFSCNQYIPMDVWLEFNSLEKLENSLIKNWS